MRRTFSLIREALRAEKEAGPKPRRDRHERDFLPAVLEIAESPASPAGRAIALTLAAFLVIAVAWALIGKIDIIATATGRIVPGDRLKVVQPLEAGIVRALHVREGQRVAAGDVLVELDPTATAADFERLGHDLLVATTEAARFAAQAEPRPLEAFAPPAEAPPALVALHRNALRAAVEEHQATMQALDHRIIEKEAEIDALAADLHRLDRLLPSIRARVENRRRLAADGYMPRLDFMELEEELIETEESRRVLLYRRQEAEAALASLLSERRQGDTTFRRDALERLAEAEARVAKLRQEVRKAEDRHRRQTLRSPVDGTVQQLQLHTIGGVVEPAQQLMTIIPADGPLEVEALVLNKDAGWIADGQPVELKIESFPFTKYGVVHGTIDHIGRDAIQDEQLGLVYPARVRMDRRTILIDDTAVPLTPGMALTAEIQTGQRRLIEYLLAPLLRYKDESLRER